MIAQNIWIAPEGVKSFLSEYHDLGSYGPLVGAIITTYLYQGREGLKSLLKRGIMVRLGRCWWIILVSFPVLIGGSLVLSV